MALIVQKFGGSSVANADKVRNVAQIVTQTYSEGNDVVVVVSAQGDTTDDLIEKAAEINPKGSKREMDVLLTAGEQMSASLLAMAIEKLGFPVISLLGWQAGFQTSSAYGNARIKSIKTDRLRAEIGRKNIVVVAGFQGLNKYDDVTTFGRPPLRLPLPCMRSAARFLRTLRAYTPPTRVRLRARRSLRRSPMTRCWNLPRSARRCSITGL
jgi:aspartate kinase